MGASESAQRALDSQADASSASVGIDDFELLTRVGEGAFGSVWMGHNKRDGRKVAIKMQDKQHVLKRGSARAVIAERDILAAIRHPFIVRLLYAFQNFEHVFLVLTWVDGGDLFLLMEELRRPFSEPEATFYAAEIALALEHLHANGIVFRDLKPENVLCGSDGHVMLTDFGLATEGGGAGASGDGGKVCGTPEFMSPEQLAANVGDFIHLPKKIDVWAFGMVRVCARVCPLCLCTELC